jgi:hypothetical protein
MKKIRGKGLSAVKAQAAFQTVLKTALQTAFVIALVAALVLSGCEQPGGGSPADSLSPDSDATLRELALSAGSLSPVFDPQTTEYTAEVSSGVDALTVSGTAASKYAVVGGQNGKKQNLKVGVNPPIGITVTARDGTEKTYTVTATRLEQGLTSIRSKDDLARIGTAGGFSLAGEYKLEADLTLENWVPVGGGRVFSGTFDGGNHKITIKSFSESVFTGTEKRIYPGIFGLVRGSLASKARIKDLVVRTEISKTVSRAGAYYVGALAGYAGAYTEMSNIKVEGSLYFANTASGSVIYFPCARSKTTAFRRSALSKS